MVLYLTGGWYTQIGQRRLRDEVVDGAIDTASGLFRAGVPPHLVSSLALKIRALASYADPPHRRHLPRPEKPGFTGPERSVMRQRLQADTDRQPALQCFINDCLEHVHDAMDLRGLYLHLVHITRMMQLLQVARISGAAAGLLGGSPDPSFASTRGGVAAEWTPPPLDDEAPEFQGPKEPGARAAKAKGAPASTSQTKSKSPRKAPSPKTKAKAKTPQKKAKPATTR